jgi:hypothetical protein
MHEDLRALGVADERVVVTGSPAFDATLARRRRWSPSGRTVLFLSQPIKTLFGGELGYTEDDVLGAVAVVVAEAGAELVVRPHPREDTEALRKRMTALPCPTRTDASADVLDAVRDARVVVGMTTMALVHAALLGAPTLSVQIDRRGKDPLPTNRDGLTIPVADASELRRQLLAALDAVAPLPPRVPAGWSPDATGRVVAALDALVGGRP